MPQIAEQITSLEQELELRIEWLEKGLKEIANGRDDMNGIYIKQQAQSILDGEPTTSDEHNKGVAVLTSGMDALAKDKKYVRISDVNKEIAKEWKNEEILRLAKEEEENFPIDLEDRDREEKINKEKTK